MSVEAAEHPRVVEQAPPRELDLILERVRAHAALRTAWLRRLWEAEGVPAGPLGVTHGEADAALAGLDDLRAETAWRDSDEAAAAARRAAAADAALAAVADGQLARIALLFGLETADVDLLELAFAAAVDPPLARLCAYLHDHADRSHASEPLAARIFGHPYPGPWPADSPLLRWRLVERHAGGIRCDPHVVAWMLGRHDLDGLLVGRAATIPARRPLEGWPVAEAAAVVRRALEGGAAMRLRIVVRGGPGAGRRTFCAAVASEIGLPALEVRVGVAEAGAAELLLRASRQAFLDGVAPVWTGPGSDDLPWSSGLAAFPVQFVVCEPGRRPAASAGALDHVVDLPAGATGDRRRLWLEHHPEAQAWGDTALDSLAARFRATPGEIAAAAAAGPTSAQAAATLVRQGTADRAGTLAQRLECPFEPEDLAVPDRVRAVLDDIVGEASARTAFWEQPAARSLFPTGRALVALFAGPPGTGKTMAAQVIARSLGFDLWRVDLSTLVSKWVGETAENVERVLQRASGSDVVLLFDEADALYGKRASDIRDAQDRYVNMDTGHLMVAVENHDGVVLLATNQKGAIDPAFLRRLRHVVDFPRPEAAQRLAIWRWIVAGLAGDDASAALGDVLEALAAVDATGSQIKYAVLGATFAARRTGRALAAEHLLAGLNRELGKEGRPLSARDVERLVGT